MNLTAAFTAAQKSVPDGVDYFRRKVTMVKGKLDEIGQVRQTAFSHCYCSLQSRMINDLLGVQALQEKQRMHDQVIKLLRQRNQEAQT